MVAVRATAVLDHARTVTERDGGARLAFADGEVGGERKLVVLDAGDVLDLAIGVHMSMRKAKCVRVTAMQVVVALAA